MSDVPNWIGEAGDDIQRYAQHFANVVSALFRVPAMYDLEMWASNDPEHPGEGEQGLIRVEVWFDDTEVDMGGSQ